MHSSTAVVVAVPEWVPAQRAWEVHSVIKIRINLACFGIWASGEQGEPVPPLPPAVPVPFSDSEVLLSQLSTPCQPSAWSSWSYTTPDPALCTQGPASALQRASSTTSVLSPLLATLGRAEHQQCQAKPQGAVGAQNLPREALGLDAPHARGHTAGRMEN